MARPSWRGHLRLSLVSCPVKLIPGTTSSEKITFNTLSKETKNRLRQQLFDPETGKVVPREDQVKGYEVEKGRYILVEDQDLAELRIESSQVLDIERFVDLAEIDRLYWDTPYLMLPDGKFADEAFAVIREAIRRKGVVGIGRVVLSSRERAVAIEPRDNGIVITTLRSGEEVRQPAAVFEEIKQVKLDEEMVELAEQIIERKRGPFDAGLFEDRYQAALQQLVEAKIKGEKPVIPKVTQTGQVIDLMAALKKSLEQGGAQAAARKPRAASRKRAAPTEADAGTGDSSPAARRSRQRKRG